MVGTALSMGEQGSAVAVVDLAIEGMTCASCVSRVEKRLGRLDGVTASVNLATERAHVVYPAAMSADSLIAEVGRAGYGASIVQRERPVEANVAASGLRIRVMVSAILTIPIVALAMVPVWQFTGWQWVSLALATPVVIWGGAPFHRATFTNLRHGAVTMDTLVTLGTGAAYLWSLGALVLGTAGELGMRHAFSLTAERADAGRVVYFEVAAGVTVFLLLGRYIEERSKRRAGAALRALLELGAHTATRLEVVGGDVGVGGAGGGEVGGGGAGGGEVVDLDGLERLEVAVPVEALRVGDLFLVRPGEKVATDGVVVRGEAAVDVSALTGESMPVEVGVGDEVVGASIVHGGSIVVRATRVGSETQLARMATLVENAQLGSSGAQRLADRVSAVFVPVVLALAVLTVAGWMLAGGTVAEGMTAAVAVLIVACPCALGLATPVALLVGTGRAAQLGILVTGPEALERTRRIDTVVFDKTGTLTTGQMTVADVVVAPGESVAVVLERAAAVERGSEHPIARAVVAAWEVGYPGRSVDVGRWAGSADVGRSVGAGRSVAEVVGVTEFRALPGFGVSADVTVRAQVGDAAGDARGDIGVEAVGGADMGISRVRVAVERADSIGTDEMVDPVLLRAIEGIRDAGRTAVVVRWEGRARAVLGVGDTVKPGAAVAVERLRALGLTPIILSGDHEATVQSVAREVRIDEVVAGVLPIEKADVVQRLRDEGRVVAMVGDGVNDAVALARADLGIAMGSGTDAAMHASDVTLVRSEPSAVVDAVRLSRRTIRIIRGNLFWAFAYNVAALPIAAFGLLNPMIAGAAMAFSSVFVVLNSLRLRKFRAEA